MSPHVMEFITWNPLQSWILDSPLRIPDSRYCIPVFVSRIGFRIQSLVGFRIPWAVFRIPKPRFLDSITKIFPDSGIRIPWHWAMYGLYILLIQISSYPEAPPNLLVLWWISFHITWFERPAVFELPIVNTSRASKALFRSCSTSRPSLLSGR